jgi:hypothetical protein
MSNSTNINKSSMGRPKSKNINKSIKEKKTKAEYTEKEYKYSKEEQELHLYIDEIDKVWKADATTPRYINKLIKNGWTTQNITYYKDGSPKAATFIAPKNAISIRKTKDATKVKTNESNKPKRVMTDEQKLAMKIGRENKKAQKAQLDK